MATDDGVPLLKCSAFYRVTKPVTLWVLVFSSNAMIYLTHILLYILIIIYVWYTCGLRSLSITTYIYIYSINTSNYRRVNIMKVMCIGSKLIHIACIHTECALTAICIECSFSQSTYIGSLMLVWRRIPPSQELIWVSYIHLHKEISNKERNNKCNVIALLRLGALFVMPCVMRFSTHYALAAPLRAP